jgi:type IV secretion system protein VirB10
MKEKKPISVIVQAMQKASSAVTKKTHYRQFLNVLFVFIVALLFLIVVFSGHHHDTKEKKKAMNEKKLKKASIQLRNNLKRLKMMNRKEESYLSGSANTRNSSTVNAEGLQSRISAPTNMSQQSVKGSGSLNHLLNGAREMVQSLPNSALPLSGEKDEVLVTATQLLHPDFTIASGEFIHGVLNVASNSDLPGMVSATVSRPAYSYTGENLLVPTGSRLIGQYASSITQGQSRILIVWNRLLLPSGVTININSPSTDSIGQAGSKADDVNRHFWERFGQATLLSILGAGTANIGVDGDDQMNSSSEYRTAVADSLQASAEQTLKGSIGIKPTLKTYQGKRINVFVANDLNFYPVRDQLGSDLLYPIY